MQSPQLPERRLPIIGLAGGIGSGKSFVAHELARLGAAVVDADRLGHEVLELPEIRAAAAARWGNEIFGPEGKIERRRLAHIVFRPDEQGAGELAYLEQLTHGPIRRRAEQQVAEMAQRAEVRAIVIDAPLLIEAGWNEFCDKIVYVEAPRQLRQARALTRGWNQEDFDRRETRQESLEVKNRLADVVIDNSGSAGHTRTQIDRLWPELIDLPRSAD